MQTMSRGVEIVENRYSDNRKLYSFEDPDFRLTEAQESINFGIKEDNALNAPSPIQNNTMQELDSEFLKEYEDAISDRDKKIAELMHEIERLKIEPNGIQILPRDENGLLKDSRKRVKTNFELLTKLAKEIQNNIGMNLRDAESPKFRIEEDRSETVNLLLEALISFEQEISSILDSFWSLNISEKPEPSFLKQDKSSHIELENIIDSLRKENIELKYELQNSIQQIQELEIEIIGLNDQTSTMKRQITDMKAMQDKISEQEEILGEKNEKLEKDLKEKKEAHLAEINSWKVAHLAEVGTWKEKYNLLIEKKQNETADHNKTRQTLAHLEAKFQDLLKEMNVKNSTIGQLSMKNQHLKAKIEKIKKSFFRFYFEKTAQLKTELNYMKKGLQEFRFQTMDYLKHNLSIIVLKFLEEKSKTQMETESVMSKQIAEIDKKLKKSKARVKSLKKELNLANEFKYTSPTEETLNMMQSKLISEIEERISLYPRDFMKDTNFFKKAFAQQEKSTQTEDVEKEKPSFYLNESGSFDFIGNIKNLARPYKI